VSKKVAVSIWIQRYLARTDAGYLVFDELKGLGVTSGGGSGAPVFTSGGYLSHDGGSMKVISICSAWSIIPLTNALTARRQRFFANICDRWF
jgi:hypothetical protein